MNWLNVYEKIIEKAKMENRRKKQGIYYEFHHIKPRSLFPELADFKEHPENGVLLTAREHFFCHQLLTKIYPGRKMLSALWFLMNRKCIILTSKQYEKIRSEVFLNKEVIEHMRQRILGKKNPQFGKARTEKEKRHFKDKIGFKIICNETGEIFASQKEAAQKLGLCRSGVLRVLNGEFKQTKGFTFRYLDKNRPDFRKKWSQETKEKFNKKQGIKLLCIENNTIYNSRVEAMKALNIPYKEIRYNKNDKYHFKEIKE